ncbi:hypothetical protein, partial [Pseudomonas nitroreducens]|uniref:hypothetical protein n=1 Tax=Pseudomonas nitroreducens TaxID=46680 RepID=UPI003D28BE3F
MIANDFRSSADSARTAQWGSDGLDQLFQHVCTIGNGCMDGVCSAARSRRFLEDSGCLLLPGNNWQQIVCRLRRGDSSIV